MRALLYTLLLLPFAGPAWAQVKEYRLVSKTAKADLNQRAILSIERSSTPESLRNAFEPVPGSHTVYLFIATFKEASFRNVDREFHDILVVKTDGEGTVYRAYPYTLEWAEMPLTANLFISTARGVKLTTDMAVADLKLRPIKERRGEVRSPAEDGILKLH